MKRDDDYIRQLLLQMEGSDEPYLLATVSHSTDAEGWKRREHAELLCDAGFFQAVNDGVYRMTNQGHDYLAVIRTDTIWSKTKSGAAKLGGVSLGLLKDIAVAYVKQEASKKLGIEI